MLAVHAPCLLITQRVWSTDPWMKLQRAKAAAERLGASTVVVHPPFRWQRDYAREFVDGVWRMADETDVRFAVENMFPWRYRDREMLAYAPDWDPTKDDYRHFTIDLSHTATSRTDALAMVDRMGDRLAHVHLADGSGSNKDEHLVPGRGSQPCAELLERLAASGFDGHVVVEVNTRRAMSAAEREADLAEALAFTRLHLASAAVGGAARRSDRREPAAPGRGGRPPRPSTRRRPGDPRPDPERGPRRVRGARLRQGVDPGIAQGGRGGPGPGPPLLRDQGAGLRGRRRARLRPRHGHPGPAVRRPRERGRAARRLRPRHLGGHGHPAPLLAIMRSARHQRDGRGDLPRTIGRNLLLRVAGELELPDAELRAELAVAQLIGSRCCATSSRWSRSPRRRSRSSSPGWGPSCSAI